MVLSEAIGLPTIVGILAVPSIRNFLKDKNGITDLCKRNLECWSSLATDTIVCCQARVTYVMTSGLCFCYLSGLLTIGVVFFQYWTLQI